MRMLKHAAAFIALAGLALVASTAQATSVAQMNLAQMVDGSDRVFVGTVIQITENQIAVGGGTVPAVTYRLKVSDTFKGDYLELKGERYTDVTMIGTLKNIASGEHPIHEFPMLTVGTEYLLFVAPTGPVGLTSPMGLGQGCFHVNGTDADKVVLNGANNVGLFRNMNTGFPDGVAVRYSELSTMIRDLVGGAQ